MEQSRTDQSAPQPKKHRMTFAEWKQSHPTITAEDEKESKAIGEMYDRVMAGIAEWFRGCEAESRRKALLAKQRRERKTCESKTKSSGRSARTRKS